MIDSFVHVSLKNQNQEKIKKTYSSTSSFTLQYPCDDPHNCMPYVLDISKGTYLFECWGSSGSSWDQQSTPGLGGYTSGFLTIDQRTTFYVYIGTTGFFNANKGFQRGVNGILPGGATDIRISTSENWFDDSSLISRIMVAAGGGGAEWKASIGGNGGTLEGGISQSAKSVSSTSTYENTCKGGTQTSGSICPNYEDGSFTGFSAAGTFGSSGIPTPTQPNGIDDYGGFGGGGYYGGTSYGHSFAGSGGSSFISGYVGCNAVYNQLPVSHKNDPYHYSGFYFKRPVMIAGNQTMPLPTSVSGIHTGNGAFRITLIHYNVTCIHNSISFRISLFYYYFINTFQES